MSKIDLSVPALGEKFVDIRETIPGDSFNWSWVRPLSQVNYLAIHHTAGPSSQTPDQIALFHINSNGWGGVGYHFLIASDGTVYYVGDISTARANVSNLNDQVLGICLIGNFTSGNSPTNEQYDSAHRLCDFFINNYPALLNLTSWDSVRGHKELPGQSTTCPGDNWPAWRPKILNGISGGTTPTPPIVVPSTPMPPSSDRGAQITELYRTILGRDPDMGGLQSYTNSGMSIDQIRSSMIESQEHHNIIGDSKQTQSLRDQVNGLQQTVNQQQLQIVSLQQTIDSLRSQTQPTPMSPESPNVPPLPPSPPPPLPPKPDTTLTLPQVLANIFGFLFLKKN